MISGAAFLSKFLAINGVVEAFAYPGTSELALCNSLQDTTINLHNSRGDSQAVFISSGYNIIKSNNSICVLHGARGLTNSLGAIGFANRNEIPLLIVVGMPSNRSKDFLPPHGENKLIEGISWITKDVFEIDFLPTIQNQEKYISILKNAYLASISKTPHGVVVLGIPQDVLENKWLSDIKDSDWQVNVENKQLEHNDLLIKAKIEIQNAKHPIILIDDFYLKNKECVRILNDLSNLIQCSIYQVNYTRGPMFFQTLSSKECQRFNGFIGNPSYNEEIRKTDLIITLEDRNMYKRVISELPDCKKIAITSNISKTLKNDYIKINDLVLEGQVDLILENILNEIKPRVYKNRALSYSEPVTDHYRMNIVFELNHFLTNQSHPILVDDSQTFGGLLSKYHEIISNKCKIIGDHSGFVGAGLSTAIGVSLANTSNHTICLLGDQGFTNGIQGLVIARELNTKLIYIVCNNGGSYSLKKQMKTISNNAPTFLGNATHLSYTTVAEAFSIPAFRIDYQKGKLGLFEELNANSKIHNQFLIELVLPDSAEFWEGIWDIKGKDE